MQAFFFIPAGSEPSGRARASIWRTPRGSNTLMLASGYLTEQQKRIQMKVGLIDVDGHHFPNIPLMKLSAWHKARGDTVEWYEPLLSGHLDRVYVSKVFSFWIIPITFGQTKL